MSGLDEEKIAELKHLQGKERFEQAVAFVIHALNTPIMVAEGYLPEEDDQDFDPGAVKRVRRSVNKIQQITEALKQELMLYRSTKD